MEHLKNILFIDIETVPLVHNYNALTEALQIEWTKKSRFVNAKTEENVEPSMLFGEKAGIFSEFAKVVCIVVGSLQKDGEVWRQANIRSYHNLYLVFDCNFFLIAPCVINFKFGSRLRKSSIKVPDNGAAPHNRTWRDDKS